MPTTERRWPFFFGPGFDAEIRSLIEGQGFADAGLACQSEAARWARALLEQGVDADRIAICEGFFHVRGNLAEAEGHAWLEVDGVIFDPTAAQFEGGFSESHYDAHAIHEGADELAAWTGGRTDDA